MRSILKIVNADTCMVCKDEPAIAYAQFIEHDAPGIGRLTINILIGAGCLQKTDEEIFEMMLEGRASE